MTLQNYLAVDLDKRALGQRCKEARLQANLSQREMARQLGYKSPTAIANKEKGLTFPSVVDVHFLSFRSGLSIDWIVSGVDPSQSSINLLTSTEILSSEESELVRQYRALGDNQKAQLAFMLIRLKDEPSH